MELGLGLVILFAGMGESQGDSSLNLSRSVKCCCKFNSIIVSSMVTDCPNLPSSIPNGKGNETGKTSIILLEMMDVHWLDSMLYIAITQVPGMALCLYVL